MERYPYLYSETEELPEPYISEFHARYIPEPNTGCWLWTGAKWGLGYPGHNYQGVSYPAHRLSYRIHKGVMRKGLCTCHTCDTPLCVNPDHLFEGTRKENTADMVKKGRGRLPPAHVRRGPTSMQSSKRKLDWDKVRYIRSSGKHYKELAREFGVTESCITAILNGYNWREDKENVA